MNLFIDSISSPASVILFNDKRNIIASHVENIARNESSTLIQSLDIFLTQSHVSYQDIKNICIVNGPGSFTGVRTTVLIANTLAFCSPSLLSSISYFDLFRDFPIIKTSSKRDSFIQKNKNSPIEALANDDIINFLTEEKIKIFSGDFDKLGNLDILNHKIPDYQRIISQIVFQGKEQITALYIKKPNIC